MTKPEMFDKSQHAIERGHSRVTQSVQMFERGRSAIEATRELIMQLSAPYLTEEPARQ